MTDLFSTPPKSHVNKLLNLSQPQPRNETATKKQRNITQKQKHEKIFNEYRSNILLTKNKPKKVLIKSLETKNYIVTLQSNHVLEFSDNVAEKLAHARLQRLTDIRYDIMPTCCYITSLRPYVMGEKDVLHIADVKISRQSKKNGRKEWVSLIFLNTGVSIKLLLQNDNISTDNTNDSGKSDNVMQPFENMNCDLSFKFEYEFQNKEIQLKNVHPIVKRLFEKNLIRLCVVQSNSHKTRFMLIPDLHFDYLFFQELYENPHTPKAQQALWHFIRYKLQVHGVTKKRVITFLNSQLQNQILKSIAREQTLRRAYEGSVYRKNTAQDIVTKQQSTMLATTYELDLIDFSSGGYSKFFVESSLYVVNMVNHLTGLTVATVTQSKDAESVERAVMQMIFTLYKQYGVVIKTHLKSIRCDAGNEFENIKNWMKRQQGVQVVSSSMHNHPRIENNNRLLMTAISKAFYAASSKSVAKEKSGIEKRDTFLKLFKSAVQQGVTTINLLPRKLQSGINMYDIKVVRGVIQNICGKKTLELTCRKTDMQNFDSGRDLYTGHKVLILNNINSLPERNIIQKAALEKDGIHKIVVKVDLKCDLILDYRNYSQAEFIILPYGNAYRSPHEMMCELIGKTNMSTNRMSENISQLRLAFESFKTRASNLATVRYQRWNRVQKEWKFKNVYRIHAIIKSRNKGQSAPHLISPIIRVGSFARLLCRSEVSTHSQYASMFTKVSEFESNGVIPRQPGLRTLRKQKDITFGEKGYMPHWSFDVYVISAVKVKLEKDGKGRSHNHHSSDVIFYCIKQDEYLKHLLYYINKSDSTHSYIKSLLKSLKPSGQLADFKDIDELREVIAFRLENDVPVYKIKTQLMNLYHEVTTSKEAVWAKHFQNPTANDMKAGLAAWRKINEVQVVPGFSNQISAIWPEATSKLTRSNKSKYVQNNFMAKSFKREELQNSYGVCLPKKIAQNTI